MITDKKVYISDSSLKKLPAKIDIERLKPYLNMTFTEKTLDNRLNELEYTEEQINEIVKYAYYSMDEFYADYPGITTNKQAMEDFLDANPQFINTQFLPNGETLLHMVFNYDMAESLIKRGADINAMDFHENTPLHSTFNPYIGELLLSEGADIKARNKEGFTPSEYQELRGNNYINEASYDRDGEDKIYGNMAIMVAKSIRDREKDLEK